MKHPVRAVALLLGVALGVVLSYTGPLFAARNSSGTYSLPAGNPVVSGTTIQTTWANNTLSDVGSEITDSLSRSGKGPMSAALELINGDATTPAMSFDSDTNTGLYRIGDDNLGITIGGTKRWDMATAGSTLTGTFTCSGATALQSTLAVTSTSAFTGAATFSNGGTATQATSNTAGWISTGNGTGAGATLTGGATGNGATVSAGGSPNGDVASRWGLQVSEGHIKLGESDPTSTTGFNDAITPMNVAKVQGRLTSSAGTWSVASGFNIASVSCATSTVTVTIADDMANTNYTIVGNTVTSAEGATVMVVNSRNVGSVLLQAHFYYWDGAAVSIDASDLCAGNNEINFVIYGAN